MSEVSQKVSGGTAAGNALGVGLPLVLMTWAAVETDHSVLRGALLAWVGFVLMLQLAAASGWKPGRGT